uniref:eIF-4F 25 kDa subunit n=1 Tax=Timema poppense TaxID=170557 RepID=A0A7R9CUB9_TIMPO|nr:unnamed protein product [Timema poppensis]
MTATKGWEENQREVTSFHTVEEFWRLYNNIKMVSDLRQGCDYSLFKKGIRPMWEDDANIRGGRWLINLEKKQRSSDLDNFCKGDKIALWTANASNSESNVAIGRKLKERLCIPSNLTIGYQHHKDTMVRAGSMTKNAYTV